MQPNPNDLPPEAQEMAQKLQKQIRRLDQIGERKNRFEAENKWLNEGIKALDESNDNEEVFKVTGPVGIKSNKEDLREELSGKIDQIESEIESMKDMEDEIEAKARENQGKLRELMSSV